MTLKKYDEIMDKIEVTEEMRNRILTNIEHTDPDSTNIVRFDQKKAPLKRKSAWKKAVPLVAGFVVLLLAGAIIYPQMLHKAQDENVQGVLSMEEFDSASDMSEKLTFEMKDIPSLTKNADETSYVAYDEDFAEITYTQGTQSICYRKSVGTEDNSGDWNEYEKREKVMIDKMSCILKGAKEDAYSLAVWTDGSFAYSLSAQNPLSQKEFEDLIVEIEKNI